jgi:S-adenosylmethionine:tRNA ribosyltransferase-isomerase
VGRARERLRSVRTADFDYELPPERIAQTPLPRRSDARLLVLRRATGAIAHHTVADLPGLLAPGDLLVVNDTRVLPARLFARRQSGGRVEVLLLHPAAGAPGPAAATAWLALVRPARRLRPGERLRLTAPDPAGADPAAPTVRIGALLGEGRAEIAFEDVAAAGVPGVLARYGEVPLPPYIHERLRDPERYQTVYARAEGSAAAPTAGLHFTPELLAALEARGVARASVTLHVGLGTFRPVTAERPEDHTLHAEWCEIGAEAAEAVRAARRRGGRVVAVGTTAVRTLESRAADGGAVAAGNGWTDLYILPGRRFRVVDALFTNFHLPRSTLLMLVAAFGGRETVLAAYAQAVRAGYRFFSFGDAMLIL